MAIRREISIAGIPVRRKIVGKSQPYEEPKHPFTQRNARKGREFDSLGVVTDEMIVYSAGKYVREPGGSIMRDYQAQLFTGAEINGSDGQGITLKRRWGKRIKYSWDSKK